jgi:hypothetical protein
MAPQSRTGKLMRGLFERFGKKNPEPVTSPTNSWSNRTRSPAEIDRQEYQMTDRVEANDEEETNWDDAEALANENNPIANPQPIVPVVAPSRSTTNPDVDNWDEALPAATVKNSNIQEVRRSKDPLSQLNVDMWDREPPNPQPQLSSSHNRSDDRTATPTFLSRAIGLWAALLQQFRRILPAPIRQLSDAILTAIAILLVTVGIWFVDGLFVPGNSPTVTNSPVVVLPTPAAPSVAIAPQISPEQAFIEAIQSQLSAVTSQYPDDIIQTLQVDFPHDRLIVRINPVWYLIGDEQQNNVTDRMWLQAKENHFTRLELQDPQGRSIARSPVVGQHMIILQRRQSY